MERLFTAFHDLIVAQGAWGFVIFLLIVANVYQYRDRVWLRDKLDASQEKRIEGGERMSTVVEANTSSINGIRSEIAVLAGIQQGLRK